jgi:c-di-GMP-binding flagellar brake protein YcgR
LTSAAIEPHTDVQVLLNLSPGDVDVVEIWSKVRRVEKRPDGQWLAGLEFTAIEPSGRDAVKRIVDATLQAGAQLALSAAGIGANVRAVDLPTTTPVT